MSILCICLCLQGKQCPPGFVEAAQRAASALWRYESAPKAEMVQQGQEPPALLSAPGAEAADTGALEECQTYTDDYKVGFVSAHATMRSSKRVLQHVQHTEMLSDSQAYSNGYKIVVVFAHVTGRHDAVASCAAGTVRV